MVYLFHKAIPYHTLYPPGLSQCSVSLALLTDMLFLFITIFLCTVLSPLPEYTEGDNGTYG